MDFDKIMHEITSGLTGDSSVDIPYLQKQMEKYKDHEMGKEILRACGRLVYEILPNDKKAELNKTLKNDFMAWNSTLDEVRFNRYKKNNEKALQLMESLIKRVEDMTSAGMFADDAVSEYRCFGEPFESILYSYLFQSKKDLRRPDDIPIAAIYLEYGSLLIDLNRVDDAQKALATAVRWNPVNSHIAFEYAETFKMQGKMDAFFEQSLHSFKIAFRPKELAHCYRNIGFFFVEKQLWQEAMACFLMSLQFESDSKNAQSELYYINATTEGKIIEPGMNELRTFSDKYGFPVGADEDVVGIAYSFGKKSLEDKQTDSARYFLQIAYDLTEAEQIKDMIDSLPQVKEN